MLKKSKILKKITDIGIVAVVRSETIEEGIRISKACVEGGIPAIEVTYTVPGATEVIKALKEQFTSNELVIGAGTVLDAATARIAILAGSEFIVSPAFDEETAKLCNLYQVPYMPGCMTITEITKAMQYGADIVKLFPGSAFGPSFVKAVKAPLPQANIMPTGGVSLENIDEWFKNGVVAVGAGGKLASGSSEDIIATAKAFVEKIKEIRNK
ncbi:bifunctional 2-keto-4-hydroxyglutarate aldolase/2-keto-3-deoxy-6-phosphogluconate aldolase [Fusobacterium varium]|jgi:2-dehydro-3-deoxyphosphogluconate aldolase/(4S)-4-hydroxy-2-oxoglutarate aldolase|uniref:bifunctional 2-keto-4-hydroxyglutarate aldolase/2-keto-3-deoxy-6-phosphogluconate aldolase n=1 Tax=Fusobacterium varium TaxID=856 RepID=UPI000E42C1E1|nr:bifunctional 2-keto-4-hydroxyglutarate aldolase/2-keto-3-deoxy-6-phosphogluconate aldolase [Fusobacterium varium]MCI6032029.1 bifunctional 2-keto-4-hydroxyglutarate aldolase/2-keto-3-deoxy-6-phosphogluconate aldolase [Fusobacterium varium]MDY4005487.1 bifunctional 2-keto-4-hydroxyglutarate aldolase/2-keto-3-deoxy-6-phosphogluconate aldolase [Fusobacterium varium]RGJ28879.1 bifunctional 4-hydroxy-2-oxoglutarate aldolase/2-dehydro-3-deoxy-phosphogluconate aldolase [Fusobacterium varium]